MDVVICGAGIAGISAAYFLAKNNITDVLVIDKNPPLSQTSAKSGENYRSWWPDSQMVHFMNRSIDIMEELAGVTDNVFNMTHRGYLYVTNKPASNFQAYFDHYRQLDVGNIRTHDGCVHNGLASPASREYEKISNGADLLSTQQVVQQKFPHLSDVTQTAVHVRRAGDISVQQLGIYLLEEAKKLGVKTLNGEVVGVETDGQGVKAIQVVADGNRHNIETRRFINAAGPFAPAVASLFDVELPIFSVLQQKIAIQDIRGVVPRDAPFTIFMDKQYLDWEEHEKEGLRSDPELQWLLHEFPGGLHIKPEGGQNGNWIKLGWAINQTAEQPKWETHVSPEFTDMVLRGAMRFIPDLRQYLGKIPKPIIQYAGYYTKTKENLPIIGPMNVSGSYIAGALSGFGTMAGCAAGELLAAWVMGNELPDYASKLSLARYDSATGIDLSMGHYLEGEL